jgi:phage/plasmid-like protein (TIGR03299 family)
MAHLIESSDTVAVYQSTAWHGLAKALEQYPSPAEARQIVAPWEIIPSTDLTVYLPTGGAVQANGYKAIVRSDNGAILGLHSHKYSPVSVGDFFDLCYEFGAVDTVKVDSAGTLRGGKTLFCSLKGDTVEIGNRGDLSKGYLLLAQAFDGTMALRGDCAFIRTVCNNTLMANHLASRTGFTLRHTRNMGDRMADVRKVIQGWKAGQDATVIEANRFAAAPVRSRAEVQEFFLRALETTYGVLPSATTTDKREQSTLAWASRSLAEIGAYWDAEEPQFGANWWTASNAVTAYLQHSTEASRLGVNSDARVYADLYGAQGDRKGAVLNLAREYAMA